MQKFNKKNTYNSQREFDCYKCFGDRVTVYINCENGCIAEANYLVTERVMEKSMVSPALIVR